jgi:UDP-2,4-diacetamido-2,4,6-trideoxy-beta-L-altropyranose hydrolase
MTASRILLVRCDAGVAIGTGHAMRCLALAQAWHDAGGQVVFAMAEATPALRERLLSEGFQIVSVEGKPGSREDARRVAELVRPSAANWVVVDGYHFAADYQRHLKDAGLQVLVIDDDGRCDNYVADLILNQNTDADESLYPHRTPYTRILLGSRYALLRREFQRWRGWNREIPPLGRRALVTMGGSDPDNLSSFAIEALMHAHVEGLEVRVVVGGSNPHVKELQQFAGRYGESLHLLREPSNMPELMAWADIAFIAAGGTLWELLFMGCSVLSYARNPVQAKIISQLNEKGIVRGLEYPQNGIQPRTVDAVVELANSQECRARFCRLARERVDGLGATRVLEFLGSGGGRQL